MGRRERWSREGAVVRGVWGLAAVAAVTPTGSAGTFVELARTGDPEPGATSGAVIAEGLATPLLGDDGTAVFGADFRINGFADGAGLLFTDPASPGGALTLVLRSPDPTPNVDGNYQAPFLPSALPDGDILSGAFIQSSLIANGLYGLYRVDGHASATTGATAELARSGSTTTAQGGSLFQIAFSGLSAPQQVASGNVYAFGAVLGGTLPGATTLRITPGGTVEQVFTSGESLAAFPGQLVTGVPRMPQVNDQDTLALYGRILDSTGSGTINTGNDEGILLRTDADGLHRVVIEGQAEPGGNGAFGNAPAVAFGQVFTDPTLNNRGDLAFAAQLTGTSGGSLDDDGVFRRNADGSLDTLVRGGDFAPGGDGRFTNLLQEGFERTVINDRGSVAFFAGLSGASGGSTSGVFLHTDVGGLDEVTRLGAAVPDGTGTISFLDNFAFNDRDELAFLAVIDTGGFGTETALLRYSPMSGLETLVRQGDALAGGTVSDLRFEATALSEGSDRDGLNNAGQIAFQAVIAGQFVNLLWSPDLIPGDYNGSGQVEQGDLDLVLQNWGDDTDANGAPTGWTNDLPQGLIDQAELDGVLLNWGDTALPDLNGSAAVPEPVALSLWAAAAAWGGRPRRLR